jgi:hypothetical protein
MEKSDIENLRKLYELSYQEGDSTAIVVVEYGEVDYENNETIKEYRNKGYKLIDSNCFGEGLEQIGEFLVFVKRKDLENG